jgi:hypothetical protein
MAAMPVRIFLIPEGAQPDDVELPWRRELLGIDASNPIAALREVKERGILVEHFWAYDDLWISGYDMADALREALEFAGAQDVAVSICWEQCQLGWRGRTWQGSLKDALEEALGLVRGVGAAPLFDRLEPGKEHLTGA